MRLKEIPRCSFNGLGCYLPLQLSNYIAHKADSWSKCSCFSELKPLACIYAGEISGPTQTLPPALVVICQLCFESRAPSGQAWLCVSILLMSSFIHEQLFTMSLTKNPIWLWGFLLLIRLKAHYQLLLAYKSRYSRYQTDSSHSANTDDKSNSRNN